MERKKLNSLIEAIPFCTIHGSGDIEITGISSHSKKVAPGNLFVARLGKVHNGTQFIEEAIQAGAIAILAERYDPALHIPQLIHSDISWAEEQLALHYYQFPSKALQVVGITGTNGKTTTSYLIKHLLDAAGIPCGLIGTIETIVGDQHFSSSLTTPDLVTNQKILSSMREVGQKAVVMEVSSHALVQGRVKGIDFSAALFTNLTREHLDYHGTIEEYTAAKVQLFTSLSKDKIAIVNADDPYASFFSSSAQQITYGIRSSAFLTARDIELTGEGIVFTAHAENQMTRVISPLIGRFNVYNLLSALAVGFSFGVSLEESAHHLQSLHRVSGRLSSVPNRLGISIFIDFAHTPDAMENILSTLKEIKKGRLLTLFGCGGNRDQGKRPEMGRIVEEFSDFVIVTSDNPREENPDFIIQDILRGMKHMPLIEVDRYVAIEKALKNAEKGDIVLIAGKGHEKVQLFADHSLPFDDFLVAEEIADRLEQQKTMK